VDLKAGLSVDGGKGPFTLPSPPAVFRDVLITGGSNGEGAPATGRLYGDVRGWDARTGALLWSFHTVPRPGEPGSETWPKGAWKNRSGTNAWGFMTVDVERGLVFVPLGSPTDDFYGADRHGHNLYGNSLVALDAQTGTLKWHQQLVHHDLWDYDPAALPALIDVRRGRDVIPAVAQITKVGLLFVFNRVTGEPVFGLEERPVPQTVVPGEYTSKTQPFPLKPHLAIPTTSGSGSEATTVAVLDLPELKVKSGISHRHLRPAQAIVDPELTHTLPPEVTSACGLDVICHAAESFLSKPFRASL